MGNTQDSFPFSSKPPGPWAQVPTNAEPGLGSRWHFIFTEDVCVCITSICSEELAGAGGVNGRAGVLALP